MHRPMVALTDADASANGNHRLHIFSYMIYCWIVSLGCCDVTEAGHADELEAERERSQLMSILAAD